MRHPKKHARAVRKTPINYRVRPYSCTTGERIAAATRAAGLGEGHTGHSCDMGIAVDLADAGATIPQLQAVGRWQSSLTVDRYVGSTVRRPQRRRPAVFPQTEEESLMDTPGGARNRPDAGSLSAPASRYADRQHQLQNWCPQ